MSRFVRGSYKRYEKNDATTTITEKIEKKIEKLQRNKKQISDFVSDSFIIHVWWCWVIPDSDNIYKSTASTKYDGMKKTFGDFKESK